VHEIVLWGLCDGASAIAMYANRQDPRVRGLVLVNPWVRDDTTYAQVQMRHYYGGRLASREWWRKLARGEVHVGDALRGALGTARRALRPAAPPAAARPSYQARMRSGVAGFGGRMLLLLSGSDLTAREFETHVAADEGWQRALTRPGSERRDFPGANHTFSLEVSRHAAEAATIAWLRGDG
jgi:exosortase A-associated hydrolase 1